MADSADSRENVPRRTMEVDLSKVIPNQDQRNQMADLARLYGGVWRARPSTCHPPNAALPERFGPLKDCTQDRRPVARPDHERPAIRHAGQARYQQDQLALYIAATHPKRLPPPKDVRIVHHLLRTLGNAYTAVRGFLMTYLGGRVTAQQREARLVYCRGCSYAWDRGDGVVFCRTQLVRCGCPAWLFAGLWWWTRRRRSECPLGRWGPGSHLSVGCAPDVSTSPDPPSP